ncbi:energy transducer TonB [Carboxylicivirga mesophila]|uniref:energy transducer TonB n=1 Tax=Carboxylicivirga mesophila TaxID=1166478 RepID=UPI001FD2992C|nr:energy transducer TonB [Carboxylicivirga mesophila]
MKAKKYRHADLENKRGIFFQVGLIVALGASLAAFEWGTTASVPYQTIEDDPFEVQDIIPITHPEEPKKELPKPKILTDLILVDDTFDGPDCDPVIIGEDTGEPFEIPEVAPEPDAEPSTFYVVEHMPEFPGGQAALLKYIATSIKYPVICVETGITGKVFISFVVNEKGEVVEAKVARSPDANLSAEALRVVNNMPQWTPGRQRDKAVRVAYTIPVNFVLQ